MLTGQTRIDNMREGAALFGVLSLLAAIWLFSAIKTGRTLYISRWSFPRMVERHSDPVGFWAMVATICAVTLILLVGAIALLISN